VENSGSPGTEARTELGEISRRLDARRRFDYGLAAAAFIVFFCPLLLRSAASPDFKTGTVAAEDLEIGQGRRVGLWLHLRDGRPAFSLYGTKPSCPLTMGVGGLGESFVGFYDSQGAMRADFLSGPDKWAPGSAMIWHPPADEQILTLTSGAADGALIYLRNARARGAGAAFYCSPQEHLRLHMVGDSRRGGLLLTAPPGPPSPLTLVRKNGRLFRLP
jgi:hypothetical protein